MVEFIDTFVYKLRFLFVGMLIIGSILLLPFLLSLMLTSPHVQAANTSSRADNTESSLEESPNIITTGVFNAADKIGEATNSATSAISSGSQAVANSVTSATVQSGKFVANGIGNGAALLADGAANSFSFSVNTTGKVIGFIGDTPPVSAMIKPAANVEIPVINEGEGEHDHVAAAETPSAVPAEIKAEAPQPQIDTEAAWPMHGTITTYFGVPHRPYQDTHTGIDISDGRRSGVTPIKPYKSGRVVQTMMSRTGLGNHVIVDHGGGITSVYGHLHSISVSVGQEINKGTTLGYQGSTGASTGTHLHFEIRVNGQYVDPRQYISGQP